MFSFPSHSALLNETSKNTIKEKRQSRVFYGPSRDLLSSPKSQTHTSEAQVTGDSQVTPVLSSVPPHVPILNNY